MAAAGCMAKPDTVLQAQRPIHAVPLDDDRLHQPVGIDQPSGDEHALSAGDDGVDSSMKSTGRHVDAWPGAASTAATRATEAHLRRYGSPAAPGIPAGNGVAAAWSRRAWRTTRVPLAARAVPGSFRHTRPLSPKRTMSAPGLRSGRSRTRPTAANSGTRLFARHHPRPQRHPMHAPGVDQHSAQPLFELLRYRPFAEQVLASKRTAGHQQPVSGHDPRHQRPDLSHEQRIGGGSKQRPANLSRKRAMRQRSFPLAPMSTSFTSGSSRVAKGPADCRSWAIRVPSFPAISTDCNGCSSTLTARILRDRCRSRAIAIWEIGGLHLAPSTVTRRRRTVDGAVPSQTSRARCRPMR